MVDTSVGSRDLTVAKEQPQIKRLTNGQPLISRKLAPYLVVLILILMGFAFRAYALESQSMWSDEGLSLYRARLDPADIFEGLIIIDGIETTDTNPPLYFLLLHGWRNLTGESIFALRYSGVLAGVLAVPLTYVLTAAAFDRRTAYFAALFMAISPFHIWQSQVLRNYSLLLTLNLASVYSLFRFLLSEDRQRRWLLLWLAAGLLGIYTHYFGFFVFAFGIIALGTMLTWQVGLFSILRRRRTWIVLGVAVLIMLPATYYAWERFQSGQQVDFYQIPVLLVISHALSGFGVGIDPSLTHAWWRVFPAVFLTLTGFIIGWRLKRLSTLLLVGYLLIPIGFMLLLSYINPLYNGVRHLLIGLPPFLVFMAVGAITDLPGKSRLNSALSWGRFLLALIVIIIQIGWLYVQFTDSNLLRDDVRGAAEYLNQVAEPTDLIILHDTIIGLTFDYYYDGDAPWKAIPTLGEQNGEAAQVTLSNAGESAERIWFLVQPTPRTGFPRKLLWDWAEKNWPRFYDHQFPRMWLRIQLNGYLPQPVIAELPEDINLVTAAYNDELRLSGLELPEQARAGKPFWTIFYWSQLQEDVNEYVLSLRLVDDQGRLWHQDDNLLWQEYLDHQWPVETLLRKDYEVSLPSGLPPGSYDLWLRVLDMDRRPVLASDGTLEQYLGNIAIETGHEIAQLPPHTAQRVNLGDIEFMGYNLPDEEIKPGHGIPFELFWRARRTPQQDYQVRTRLLDPAGNIVGEAINPPTRADYPTSLWQEGELLQSKFQMLMPGNIEILPHSIEVALIDIQTDEEIGQIILKDQLTADPWPFTAELPSNLQSLDAVVGQPPLIALRGYRLPETVVRPGDILDLTLFWQALENVPQGYYVFIHFMTLDGQMVAQRDGAPQKGFRPTLSWREGEVIEDEYQLSITPGIPPGTYQLWAGMYHPGSGERPPVQIDGQLTPDNRVLIGEIEVKPE